MPYDLFLSYSRDDLGWAVKLESSLKERNLNVFRDQRRLVAGDQWEQALTKALGESRHLVALWSASARNSDWVTRELGHFDALSNQDSRRRIIAVSLDGTANRAYSSLQTITSLVDLQPTPTHPDDVAAEAWADVVRRVAETVDEQDDAVPVEVAVLTLTQDEADPGKKGGLGQPELEQINASFGLDEPSVRARYQPNRLDWRPYGDALSIRSILDGLIADLNRVARHSKFRWRPASPALWDDMETNGPQDAVAQLAAQPLSLVVVDTLVLRYHPVYQRAMLLRQYLTSKSCAWLLIPPLASERQFLVYRNTLKAWSAPLLNDYFEPPVPRRESSAPLFGIYCCDDREIKRLLRAAAGEYLAQRPPTGNVFTRMRAIE
jgi:hypothetical protein